MERIVLKTKTMTLSDTNKTIELLKSISSDDDYAYERAVLAYLQLDGLPIFTTEIPAGASLFHARTHTSDDLFLKVSDISIPPQQCVKDFARCNRPFQSVFYSSENRITSYMELVEYWAESRNIGETLKVTIGMWELKRPLSVVIVTTPDTNNRISDYDRTHGEAFDTTIVGKYKGEELEAQKVFFRFLFENFRKQAKKDLKTYIITSSYCNVALMHAIGEADGIYYPSVPFQGNGVNICINKNFCKPENIELKSAARNEFTITENEQKQYTFTETSKIEANRIDLQNDLIVWNK